MFNPEGSQIVFSNLWKWKSRNKWENECNVALNEAQGNQVSTVSTSHKTGGNCRDWHIAQYFGICKVRTELVLKLNGCNTESLSKQSLAARKKGEE